MRTLTRADGDGDGIGDLCDACPTGSGTDEDLDLVCSDDDNCPDIANQAQNDFDQDGAGERV